MVAALSSLGRFGSFAGRVVFGALRRPLFLDQVWRQTAITSMRCLIPVVAVIFPFGMVLALQGLVIFAIFGAQRMLSALVAVSVIRELAPMLTAVLVAAQGGSSCAAELGAMRIREELDATEVMAVDSLKYHVGPRVLALAIATPMLNVVGSFAGLLGAYITAVYIKGESGGVFIAELWTLAMPADAWAGTVKCLCFGALIGIIAGWHGYNASGGAEGVGRAVNNTVVHSVVAFIVLNYFLTSAFFSGVNL